MRRISLGVVWSNYEKPHAFQMKLQRRENWLPIAIIVPAIGVVLWFLFYQFGYSTGYMFERASIWSSMQHGYRMRDSEWGFGYFVLPAVLILLWVTRDRYQDVPINPSWHGLLLIGIALFFYFGGYKANEKFIGYASGQLLVAGMVVWFGGWALFRRAFWLWILFGLVWPLTFLINPISFPLRKLMTILTYGFLQLIGEDVVREGTTIKSAPTETMAAGERFNLGIAAACSGLRSLFALGMVSLLYGYIALEKGWHRFVLLLSTLPFAIIGNFVRMILLYLGTITISSEFAIGEGEHDPSAYHIGAGIMVFIVALLCMMLLVAVLKGGIASLKRKRTRVRKVDAGSADETATEPS